METYLASLPLEVVCNYLQRLDVRTLVALSKNPEFQEKIQFCVQELRIPPGQEVADTNLLQFSVVRSSSVISLQSFQNLASISSRVRGDLSLILDETWKGRTTDELGPRVVEALHWLFIRKTLYPENRAVLRIRNQGYEFAWLPKSHRLNLYFPSGLHDYDYAEARNEEEAVLPLNQTLNPLLIRLVPSVRKYTFIPYSVPDEGEGVSSNLIGTSYGPFLRAISEYGKMVDYWEGYRAFLQRNLQEFPVDE